ncbi:MAG TPA: TetR family transcriptional regulator [Nannocystis sp.]
MQRTRRGRPQEADPREIARIALDLFEREGFDRVTMDEIAHAASVSRRTLFRLFPSKWDLVWGSLGDILDVIRQRAAALSGADLRVGGVLREFIEPFLRPLDDPEAAAMARRRLRVIASAPALLDHPTLREIEVVLATTVAAGPSPNGAPPLLVAHALVAVTIAALMWWAEHGQDTSALEATRAAFRALAQADEPDPPASPPTTR